MQGHAQRRWDAICVLFLVVGLPSAVYGNDMCMVVPVCSFPFFVAGMVLAGIVRLIASRGAGRKGVLTAMLWLGGALTGIPVVTGAVFAIIAAATCSTGHAGAAGFFSMSFLAYAATVVWAGRAVARRRASPATAGVPAEAGPSPTLERALTKNAVAVAQDTKQE